jgi:hypothetical protein
MMVRRSACAASAAFALFILPVGAARAESGDGLYDRLSGDLHAEIDAGPAFDKRGAWGALIGHVHYLDTAGIYATYTDALGASRDFGRTVSAGVSVRPVFLPRWGTNLDRGPSVLDLTVDSLTFDLGALWPLSLRSPEGSPPGGAPRSGPGFELAATLELPLFGRSGGAWLGVRGALRYASSELASSEAPDRKLGPMATITLGWREIMLTHWVDAGDERSR